jgi:hypothetical protein
MLNTLNHFQNIALSDNEVLKIIDGKANLEVYPNLHKYKSIDQLLGKYGACIILYEAMPNYGHWCCIFKVNNKLIEYFNPYGGFHEGFPDDSLNFIPPDFRETSNQNYPYLSRLMYISPYELSYNEISFQKKGNDIKTCGRWCALRLSLRKYDLYQFYDIVESLKQKMKLSNDKLVTLLTMK